MKKLLRITFAAVLPAVFAAGCSDTLSGPKLDSDPNRPTTASRDQLLMAVQASQFQLQTGALARVASIFTQQMAGTDRQYLTLGRYQFTEDDFSSQFSRTYTGGGLIDLRRIQTDAASSNDRVYAGVAKVWEALVVGTAASIWGDLPYSEAVGATAQPKLDEQAEVYAKVQSLLDEAIADLQSGTGRGPGANDLVYGGNTARWVEAAHTLKARFYLHMAEVDRSNYARALAAAQMGISTPSNDFRAFASTTPGEENLWYQFAFRERDSYIRAGKHLVDLLQARDDDRLEAYFAPNANGDFIGAAPGQAFRPEQSTLSSTRGAPAFRQPIVTWAENQLIMAEAAFQMGDESTARARLNAVRAAAEYPEADGSVSGGALLEAIMTEKYIEGFQNIESWNDYKRTCLPRLMPAEGASEVPGRLFYGSAERNANPNIPAPSQQPQRNDNDPTACS